MLLSVYIVSDKPCRHMIDSPVHAWSKEDIHQDQIVPGLIHFLDSLLSIIDSLDDTSEFLQELARQLPIHDIILHDQNLGRMSPGCNDRSRSPQIPGR